VKLTKSKLRQIIREDLETVINEREGTLNKIWNDLKSELSIIKRDGLWPSLKDAFPEEQSAFRVIKNTLAGDNEAGRRMRKYAPTLMAVVNDEYDLTTAEETALNQRVFGDGSQRGISLDMMEVTKTMKLTKSKLKQIIKETIKEAGMPSSVSKHKQALADMSDEEFATQYGAKSEEQLRQMAWSHGYGKMSPHYWNRVKRASEKGVEQE